MLNAQEDMIMNRIELIALFRSLTALLDAGDVDKVRAIMDEIITEAKRKKDD